MPFEILPTLTRSFKPPVPLFPWLTYPDELSAKLRSMAAEVQLTLLNQAWMPAGWWATSVLGLTSAPVVQRDVLISAEHNPCWQGRTLIPQPTWVNNTAFFERLRHQSLGSLVFYNDRVERVRTHYYAVDATCLEYYWPDKALTASESLLWMRLSEFVISKQYPFNLTEIFLPGLLRVIG